MYIEIQHVGKVFEQNGKPFTALHDVNLQIQRGEFICLLGPSGCGKSTLLNCLAGFEQVTEGSITIDGKRVEKPSMKNVTIFQNYGLLPWRTVQKNIELGLEAKKLPKQQKQQLAEQYMELVGLTDFAQRCPAELSGGMQQRVAIARALAVDPDILFMDEPFGALDVFTRMKMQNDILKLQQSNHKTVIFVTHDIEEAVYLADRIVIMTPNPAKIKTVLNVPLGEIRDRTDDRFAAVRDQVFELFELAHKNDPIEYYL